MKALFVCKGNVGRSQIAEGLFNKISKTHKAASAGTVAKDAGQKLSERASKNVRLMKEIGIDISNNKVKKLDEGMIESVDRVIIFCSRKSWPKYLLDSNKVEYWRSKDTKYMSYKERREFRDATGKRIEKFLEEVGK